MSNVTLFNVIDTDKNGFIDAAELKETPLFKNITRKTFKDTLVTEMPTICSPTWNAIQTNQKK